MRGLNRMDYSRDAAIVVVARSLGEGIEVGKGKIS